jgi:hypothetical protein
LGHLDDGERASPTPHHIGLVPCFAACFSARRRANDSAILALHGTRVDVLFKGVKAIQLPTSLRGLTMARASPPEGREITAKVGTRLSDRDQVFVLRGESYVGFVVALVAFVHDDEGQYYDQSYFAKSFMPNNQP